MLYVAKWARHADPVLGPVIMIVDKVFCQDFLHTTSFSNVLTNLMAYVAHTNVKCYKYVQWARCD